MFLSRRTFCRLTFYGFLGALPALLSLPVRAQDRVLWSDQERPIVDQLKSLRMLDDDARARTTKNLALQIRTLPAVPNKVRLAEALANLATEGDSGRDTLQEVTTTFADAVQQQPGPSQKAGAPGRIYIELASLARYEHMHVESNDPQYAGAMRRLEADDAKRQNADFSLTDLEGKNWQLRDLRGKVVLLNFWGTWCPPCRKEMPDLQALYDQYKNQGFVVLAISDEAVLKIAPFVAERNLTYPVLLDPGRKVNMAFIVEGIPKSFVYDRAGKLVAQSIDMRTRNQFQAMLAKAGLQSTQ